MQWVANPKMRVQIPLQLSSIAQSVEHMAVNHSVVGSSPIWGELTTAIFNWCACRLGSSVGRVKD